MKKRIKRRNIKIKTGDVSSYQSNVEYNKECETPNRKDIEFINKVYDFRGTSMESQVRQAWNKFSQSLYNQNIHQQLD